MKRDPDNPTLSRSAELTLRKVRLILSRGYTGKIELMCSQGGIRTVTLGQDWRSYGPDELDDAA